MKWSDDQVIKTIMETNTNVKVLVTQLVELKECHRADVLRLESDLDKAVMDRAKLTRRVENIEKAPGNENLIQRDWKYYGKEGSKITVFLGMIAYLTYELVSMFRGG